jgi:hypothetical protein
MLVLFIHITRLASNEIFWPSNKIHREVGRVKDLPAPMYKLNDEICVDGNTDTFNYICFDFSWWMAKILLVGFGADELKAFYDQSTLKQVAAA